MFHNGLGLISLLVWLSFQGGLVADGVHDLENDQEGLEFLNSEHRKEVVGRVKKFVEQNQALPSNWDSWLEKYYALLEQKKQLKDLPVADIPNLSAEQTRQMERLMSQTQSKWIVQLGQIYDPSKHPQFNKGNLWTKDLQYLSEISTQHRKNTLVQQAGKKVPRSFLKYVCNTQWQKIYKHIDCNKLIQSETKAFIGKNDQPEALVAGWFTSKEKLKYGMDELFDKNKLNLTKGQTKRNLWSDDYWRIQWGITAYRYASDESFESWQQAVSAYSQPVDGEEAFLGNSGRLEWRKSGKKDTGWFDILGAHNIFDLNSIPNSLLSKIADNVENYSPAEKYDLLMGDENFTLTKQQKEEGFGLASRDENSGKILEPMDVEPWMGICHGWAPAAYMVPKPDKPVQVRGARGAQLTFWPHDVRALASLAWANGSTQTNYVGGRCNVKSPDAHPNGRTKQTECFDNNPATFAYALAWMVGIKKASFVMDKTFDYQVWNQPIDSYEITFFDPTKDPENKKHWNKNYRKVWVDYKNYKKHDRFQHPKYGTRTKDKSLLSKMKVVGILFTVDYLVEVAPTSGNTPSENATFQASYVADLELLPIKEDGTHYRMAGGEWWDNNHPDFLWTPRKESVAYANLDEVPLPLNITRNTVSLNTDEEVLTGTVRPASHAGYPLCQVLSALVEKSSGDEYNCR